MTAMVRGHAKEVAQNKNSAKMAEKAKSTKRDSSEVCMNSLESATQKI